MIVCCNSNCREELNDDSKFCNHCGHLQPPVVKGDVKSPYNNTFGFWKVSTEGDCEGRSMIDLGVHEGHIDEIAKELASSCYYSLQFRAVGNPKHKGRAVKETPKQVSVSLDIGSGTWDMQPEKRAQVLANVFKDRPVDVATGQYYASVILIFRPKVGGKKR